jgi:ESCRT-I complex subunit VPS28
MDSLKLNLVAVDQIHPLLSDLMQSLNKVPLMPDYEGKGKVREWLISLNQMKATDELNGDQVRQLLFDLESSYTGFHRCLSTK